MPTRRRARPKKSGPTRPSRVELAPGGLKVGHEVVPLHAAAVHYWRLEVDAWRRALSAAKGLGFRLIDTYVPWAVHEQGPGEFDFGRRDPRLNVQHFVELVGELGLHCIVRPGPHINAELTGFGVPERVLWDSECQARSPRGNPVVLPVPPLTFPVPSYASEIFHSEVARWFAAVGAELGELVHPKGPIVLLQVDNEGALYFRDGVYDQDWHPDALRKYRRFLQSRYERVATLREVYGDPRATFARVEPPKSFTAKTASELAPHLDWAEYQEQMLADAFALMREHLEAAGLGGVPTSHNLPLSEGATPLDPARIGEVVDLLGLDYYHGASAPQRSEIARRTSELAERSRARNHPPFACELGAGFPPFFPPLTERDNFFTVLAALAYGLRGFNAYMAVERDRWIGAPIDASGRTRPVAERWSELLSALERTRFHELHREAAVHIVVPRSFRRLARVMHAFGPLSAALVQVLGGGATESCFEDELGLGAPVVIETERFVRQLEHAFEHARIPHAVVSGDLMDHSLDVASWVIVACTGALEDPLHETLGRAWKRGRAVSVGPFVPRYDASFRERATTLAIPAKLPREIPPTLGLGPEALDETIARAKLALELPALQLTPLDVQGTLHVDALGRPRVLFLLNPNEWARECSVALPGVKRAADALSGAELPIEGQTLRAPVGGRTVRMLELSPA